MIEMVQANPALMQIAGDLMVKNMDWPGAEELSERLKLTLPPEIAQAEAAKKQKSMPPEMQQIVSQFEQAMQQKEEVMGKAAAKIEELMGELEEMKRTANDKQNEVIVKAASVEIDAYKAETDRMQAMAQAMTPEQVQMMVMQTLQDLMTPNVVPMEPEMQQEVPAEMPMANVPPQGAELPMEQPNVY